MNSYENMDDGDDDDDDDENPLDVHKFASNEIILVNRSYDNEFISIVPGECATPVPFSHKLFCEILL